MSVLVLFREQSALIYTETVLFIGYDKTGIYKFRSIREKRLRADDYVKAFRFIFRLHCRVYLSLGSRITAAR
jgi:hypothetical protein